MVDAYFLIRVSHTQNHNTTREFLNQINTHSGTNWSDIFLFVSRS